MSFAVVCGCGAACLALLGGRARRLLPVWCGYLLVFAAGAALPLLTDSPLLLDLHPMRVGAGCVVMLSVIAIVAYLGKVLEGTAASPRSGAAGAAAAGLALLCLAVGQGALLAMAAAIAFIAAPSWAMPAWAMPAWAIPAWAAPVRGPGSASGVPARLLATLGRLGCPGQTATLVLLAAGLLAVAA